jgi:hypothetical protein
MDCISKIIFDKDKANMELDDVVVAAVLHHIVESDRQNDLWQAENPVRNTAVSECNPK